MVATGHGRRTSKPKNSNATSIQMMSVDSICPNSYNPNHMTDDEFNEFVSEVRHLGRLPKPVIVRQLRNSEPEHTSQAVTATSSNGQAFEIVDGEHGWRAAKEVGLKEIPVEVDDLDDFEARRQTYKRNQHGSHKPVALGQMFQQMLDDRGISQRELADTIQVSEGTVRNMLLYAKAADLRNDYAPCDATGEANEEQMPKGSREIADLTVAEVRCYIKLPVPIRDLWLGSGAPKPALWKALGEPFGYLADHPKFADSEFKSVVRSYERLCSSGVLEFLKHPPTSPSIFVSDIQALVKWDKFNSKYKCEGVSLEEIRQYTKHRLWGVFYVRDETMMSWALNMILQPARRNEAGDDIVPGQFLLTPEEFEQAIDQTGKERSSALDFERRIDLAVTTKHGSRPDTNLSVEMELLKLRIAEEAPEFIRDADIPDKLKAALWEAKASDEAKTKFIDDDERVHPEKNQELRDAVKMRLDWLQRRIDLVSEFQEKTPEDHARAISERLYDPKSAQEQCDALADKLVSACSAEELVVLNQGLEFAMGMRDWVDAISSMRNMKI